MSKDHFLPLFVGDFLASTATWEAQEAGTYALLLMHQWASGSLPRDAGRLARILRMPVEDFAKVWETIAPKFKVVEGGRIKNPRLEEVRGENEARQRARIEKAQRAAHARWDATSNATSNAQSNAQSNASSMNGSHAPSNAPSIISGAVQDAPSNASDPIRSVSDPIRDENPKSAEMPAAKPKRPKGAKPNLDIDRGEYPNVNWAAYDRYHEYRREKHYGSLGRRGRLLLAEHLSLFPAAVQQAMVDQSERLGWQGVFELRVANGSGQIRPAVHIRSVAELEAEAAAAGADHKQGMDHKQTEGESHG